jgi:adenine-specific DNA-methyltransferase
MAGIDDLLSEITDDRLRNRLAKELQKLRGRRRLGLVFESHIPETVTLASTRVKVGSLVTPRKRERSSQWTVESITGRNAQIKRADTGETLKCPVEDLLLVKPFGEAVYPTLRQMEALERDSDRPWHAAINGENYHALQLLSYLYEGQVDCIYLDPPYNTGAKDWTYNNRFVDTNDAYRHSKWLSFMEKRLRVAKRLLKSDGVLIVTIDEHEVNRLGLLLEQIFPEYQRTMVTIVISAAGNNADNFSRVEEHAFFCVPQIGREIITGASIDLMGEEELSEGDEEEDRGDPESDEQEEPASDYYLASATDGLRTLTENARRRGKESLRKDRVSMFFPIYIDPKARKVVEIGDPIPLSDEPDLTPRNGLVPVWPIDSHGHHRRWRWGNKEMKAAAAAGELLVGKYNAKRNSWTINRSQQKPAATFQKIKTVWRQKSHSSGTHGSGLLQKYLGSSQAFSFPKSVYAVRDCLAAVVRTKPDALIVDAFAGSGTTFHATCLLNEADDGERRCILVTNNEVEPGLAAALREEGSFPGDAKYEAMGIFENVTRPRCKAVVTGQRPDGSPVPGKHLNGRPHSSGFEENIAFFKLDYLDPNDVTLGNEFNAIVPLLWLAAGGVGECPTHDPELDWLLPQDCPFGVLIEPDSFSAFHQKLLDRPDVNHIWIVTDDEAAFARFREQLRHFEHVGMLYRDYLRNFVINMERV